VLLTGFRTGTTPPFPAGLEVRVRGLELSLNIRSYFFPRFSVIYGWGHRVTRVALISSSLKTLYRLRGKGRSPLDWKDRRYVSIVIGPGRRSSMADLVVLCTASVYRILSFESESSSSKDVFSTFFFISTSSSSSNSND
jgi:hypothetical protein